MMRRRRRRSILRNSAISFLLRKIRLLLLSLDKLRVAFIKEEVDGRAIKAVSASAANDLNFSVEW